MNLQMIALEKLVKSGGPVDLENPVVKNVMHDVEKAFLYLDSKLGLFRTRVLKLHDRVRDAKFKLPDMTEYNEIRYEIENTLFDDFDCETPEQTAWKEYFMGLYNIVIVPKMDNYTTAILLVNVLKYYDALEPPKILDVNDELYVTSRTLVDYFRVLREINTVLVKNFDIQEAFREHVKKETEARTEYLESRRRLDELMALRGRYQDILKPSTGAIGPAGA